MEKYSVKAVDIKSLSETEMIIEADEGETSDYIVLTAHLPDNELTVKNYYYFSAFQELRDKLLKMGCGLKCNGARLNAVQSEMMACTEKVYLVTLGNQALMKDVVSMYDFADISDFPDTSEQNDFYEKWISSLKNQTS